MSTGQCYPGYSVLLREIESLRVERGVTGIGLILLSLKGVRDINSTLGYVTGDRVLEVIAGRVADIRRPQDFLLRINGTLFALLVCNPLHEGHVMLGAEKAVRVVTEPVDIGDDRTRLRALAGISLLPGSAMTAEDLVRQCELAIDEAERRDERYVIYTPAMSSAKVAEREAWSDVDDALRNGEFEIHYQPKVKLRNGLLIGAEALARWHHPEKGLIAPSHFMPVIEGTDSVRTLLWFVLNAGLRQASAWNQAWPGFRMAINVSPTSLADADLVEVLRDVIQVWDFPARQLVLEITENALMRNPAESTRRLHRLREIGVQISIDDFGTGYSNLAYLKELPANELKIDKSFVLPIAQMETDRRLVESVIQLGHAVGLEVVAEGIEDEATLRALTQMGCDIGQGFHLGRPVDAPAFEAQWFQGNAASMALRSA